MTATWKKRALRRPNTANPALGICRRALIAGALVAVLAPVAAQAFPAYQGRKRVLVVLAPSDQNPGLARQRAWIAGQRTALSDRDIVVVAIAGNAVSSDLGPPPGISGPAIRTMLRAPEGAFRVMLLGKDGKAVLDSPVPVAVTAIIGAIDRTPLRTEPGQRRGP